MKYLMRMLCWVLIGVGSINISMAAVNDSGIKTPWSYVGNNAPAMWGHLNPAFLKCAAGKLQSPINIPKKTTAQNGAFVFHYHGTTFDIVNDGETLLQIGDQQTLIHDGHGLQVNFAPDHHELIMLNGETYRLVQFHLHTPSETAVRGRATPLEIHFVHQGEHGHVAVVAVMVTAGAANSELQKIIDNIPAKAGEVMPVHGIEINPAGLLPQGKSYYSFQGSLTTPPCTEGLSWVVLANNITATPAQILQIRRANNGVNARPVQPLNKRAVYFSTENR